jgi:hypothetical protein
MISLTEETLMKYCSSQVVGEERGFVRIRSKDCTRVDRHGPNGSSNSIITLIVITVE